MPLNIRQVLEKFPAASVEQQDKITSLLKQNYDLSRSNQEADSQFLRLVGPVLQSVTQLLALMLHDSFAKRRFDTHSAPKNLLIQFIFINAGLCLKEWCENTIKHWVFYSGSYTHLCLADYKESDVSVFQAHLKKENSLLRNYNIKSLLFSESFDRYAVRGQCISPFLSLLLHAVAKNTMHLLASSKWCAAAFFAISPIRSHLSFMPSMELEQAKYDLQRFLDNPIKYLEDKPNICFATPHL